MQKPSGEDVSTIRRELLQAVVREDNSMASELGIRGG